MATNAPTIYSRHYPMMLSKWLPAMPSCVVYFDQLTGAPHAIRWLNQTTLMMSTHKRQALQKCPGSNATLRGRQYPLGVLDTKKEQVPNKVP